MEWNGNLRQAITLPRGAGQQPWVDERSSLPGTTEERRREWQERFAHPVLVERKGYGPWRYADLKQLGDLLRAEAKRRGIEDFKVGSLVYAWDNAYGDGTPWADAHPEAFTRLHDTANPGPQVFRYFDPAATMHADAKPLGGLPTGFPEGMPVHQAFAAQWGNLSRSVGLDALMLRDSFGFPIPYRRRGPLGPLMPSPEAIRRATESTAALVRETKQANPRALVMMYSNGASALADWRSNGTDLETIAKEGFLDIFVDQTWAGSWNEVGVRHNTFWNRPTLGWTYQLAYMLLHGAVLAGTGVRHYPLIETFDAWESWDVIHTVPDRLRWSIWAYSHAAIKTPHGLEMPKGSYISWANQGKRLLSPEDVAFLNGTANAALTDAHQTSQVFGPTLVYSRAAMEWQAQHATAAGDIKEWIDEQAGSIIKWPVPILSATRLEWLPQIESDLPVLQTPSHLPANESNAVKSFIASGHPVAIFGSFAGGIDSGLLNPRNLRAGFIPGELAPTVHQASIGAAARSIGIDHLPTTFNVHELLDLPIERQGGRLSSTQADKKSIVYTIDGSPQLLLEREPHLNLVLWDPPDFLADPDRFDKPLPADWGSSPAPYALAAASLNELLRLEGALHARHIDIDQTGTVGAWRTQDRKLHLLFGNLEEGLRDDADASRNFTLELLTAWKGTQWQSVWDSPFALPGDRATIEVRMKADSSILLESEPH